MQDSIPIHRDTLKHWIYSDAEYFKVWVTMLARARYLKEPKTIMYEKALCTLNYGEFIFGYKAWSDKTGVSYQRLRGLVKKLLIDKMLRITVTTNHYTVYEVVNYSKFNSQPTQEIQGVEELCNSQVTVSQQSGNSQVTTNKEYIKKEKNDKEKYIADFTTSGDLIEAINSFIEMRKSLKKPMTDNAVKLMLGKLKKLSLNESVQIDILNQSVMSSWTDIYPITQQKLFDSQKPKQTVADKAKEAAERYANRHGIKTNNADQRNIPFIENRC